MRCPQCKNTFELKILAGLWLSVVPSEPHQEFETDCEQQDHEWDDENIVLCSGCFWSGSVKNLEDRAGLDNVHYEGTSR